MGQTTIFDFLYPKYKIDKPIRLIECFAGYGSQALALKYLGIPFEHYKISEWAIKSIQAYKDMHFTEIEEDYTKEMTKEDLVEYFKEHNISSNYNDPLNEIQLKRLSDIQLRNIYNNMKITHNLGSIVNIEGSDLEINDKEHYTYLLTYSFPCQDLSMAGKRAGMDDTSTRSGMLWEVERILDECKELPNILLMENVQQVIGNDNLDNFVKWTKKLESLGYKNYWQNLIATDYGIPQTRNRTFMVSILGDYSYNFPQPIPLNLKLKDILEDNVDEKYYLSDKMIKCFTRQTNDNKFPRKERFEQSLKQPNDKGIANTITTCAGNRATDNFIKTSGGKSQGATKGIATNESEEWQKEPLEEKSRTILANKSNGGVGCIDSNLRIRKLTPKECFRLMGVKDEDYEKVARNQSNASLYHLAGDSIVVNVLMSIFEMMI